jgi:predicted alpha/beta-hydrolase family hydrolase
MADRGMLALAEQFRSQGMHVVRFNFLYREKRAGRPDAMLRLKECISAVALRARQEVHSERLIIGGRSMGGRAASMLAADGFPCDALLLLAYPLHPRATRKNFAMRTSRGSGFPFSERYPRCPYQTRPDADVVIA